MNRLVSGTPRMAAPLTSLTPRECSHNRGVHNHSQVPSHIWGVGTSKVVKRLQTRNFAVIDPSQMTLVADLADLDPASAGIIAAVLKPTLSIGSLLMIVRIVMTWYPEVDATKFPWSIAYTPTEPVLSATRKVVKPFNGLDVSPIVWFAILSFLSEILTGPQGILSLLQRKGL